MLKPLMLTAVLALGTTSAALAADPALPDPAQGYLCCNMRTDGGWISDANYAENGKQIIKLGTPMTVTGYGRYRVHVLLDGKKQDLGNDYSRDLDLLTFAKRYLVTEDPAKKLAHFPPKIRKAIENAQVTPGMTREQVFMSLGYPISSENPKLDARLLRYWRSSFAEFQLIFDGDRLKQIDTDPQTRNLVVAE
jgi:hypothetical protein